MLPRSATHDAASRQPGHNGLGADDFDCRKHPAFKTISSAPEIRCIARLLAASNLAVLKGEPNATLNALRPSRAPESFNARLKSGNSWSIESDRKSTRLNSSH